MHAALALASSHDRYLRRLTPSKSSFCEVYHWSKSIALFNQKLSSPIQPQDRDAFWATATYLGIVSFTTFDASRPEEAWPLNPHCGSSNLEWLRMSVGKKALWDLTDPLRPDSVFHPMAPAYARMHTPLPSSGLENVPAVLRRLCRIDAASTATSNPYFTAVQALSLLARKPPDRVLLFSALPFLSQINHVFKALLEKKDAVALLLLALWYAEASHVVWWIERRAEVEGRAICLYLERYHWDDDTIMGLLPWRSAVHHTLMPPTTLEDWCLAEDIERLATYESYFPGALTASS